MSVFSVTLRGGRHDDDAQNRCPFGPGFDFTDPDVLLHRTGLVERTVGVDLRRRGLLEEKSAISARQIVAAAREKATGDFVTDIAMCLPLQSIADLISIMNTDDPDFDFDPTVAKAELMGYAYTMAEERRRCPADDIVTRLNPGRHRRRIPR